MHTTTAVPRLIGFREEVYRAALGHRKDSLFELLDAVLVSDGPVSLVRHSLSPSVRRRWPSLPDALADGTLHRAALHALLTRTLPPPAPAARAVWAVDGTLWPRPTATTSPARTYGQRPVAGQPERVLVPAWEYQWLVAVPEPQGSWVLPLDVRRRPPTAPSPTQTAIEQVRAVLEHAPADQARPVITLDSGYAPVAVARAGLGGDCLVRLPSRRRLYRAPGPYRGRGRRPVHGPVFRCHDPATQGQPDCHATAADPRHGWVQVAVWTNLHAQGGHDAPFTVVRVTVGRLPRRTRPPAPLWLAWVGGPLPDDLLQLWAWYGRRFAIEHGFRFAKQHLGWTRVHLRDPHAADRWTWLLVLAVWQLWLARSLVGDCRLPWERPLDPACLTPGRVRRALAALLPTVGTPARPPRPRGNAPGRRTGERPGRHPRHPVVRRAAARVV